MDDRQKPIAAWMNEVIERRGISARAWAELAGLGKDTVSRAIRDDYDNVTSSRTIAKLADALDELPPGVAGTIPNVASLEAILDVFLTALGPARGPTQDSVHGFAVGLRETLLQLADAPHEANAPSASRAVAKSAVRRLSAPGATH